MSVKQEKLLTSLKEANLRRSLVLLATLFQTRLFKFAEFK